MACTRILMAVSVWDSYAVSLVEYSRAKLSKRKFCESALEVPLSMIVRFS